jgi:Leucine-rich repeat (LRR) protein
VTCEFGRVVSLDLEENNLVGTLPAQLANLTMLRTLELQQNSNTEGGTVGGLLQGTLPDFGALVNLVVLDLSENHFSGSLPPGIWNLQNLVELNLAENDLLGGPFPSTITMLSLQRLDAQEAGFHGVLPTTMTMPALTFLNLDNNDPELDGPLDVLWTLTTVTELDVSLNGFTGGVVPEIADMASLQDLDISDNQLSGPMDDGILQLADTMTEFSSNGNGCFTSSAAVDMFLSAIEPTWNEAGQCPPPPP